MSVCHVLNFIGYPFVLEGGKIILAGGKIILAGEQILNLFVGRNGHLPTIQLGFWRQKVA